MLARTDETLGRPQAAVGRPLRSAAVTIYGTLILLGLAIPGSVVGALQDGSPSPVKDAALAVAVRIQSAMEATGLPAVYEAAKARFRAISCGGPDSSNPC